VRHFTGESIEKISFNCGIALLSSTRNRRLGWNIYYKGRGRRTNNKNKT